MSISDNGDRNKILATIFRAVYLYTRQFPTRWIYFSGNTDGKMRLYRMAISLNWEELSSRFEIYGEVAGIEDVLPFHKQMPVEGFFIRRKWQKLVNFELENTFCNFITRSATMKKNNKKATSFSLGGFNLVIDENLNKQKGTPGNPEKLAEANRRLRKIKSPPK